MPWYLHHSVCVGEREPHTSLGIVPVHISIILLSGYRESIPFPSFLPPFYLILLFFSLVDFLCFFETGIHCVALAGLEPGV